MIPKSQIGQWTDSSANQYGSLPVVMENCLSEQVPRDVYLAAETFAVYNQFLKNPIEYTTNNFSKHNFSSHTTEVKNL
jgi:hypothetical protein